MLVSITGIGLMAPHGQVPNSVFDALMRGESAIRYLDVPATAPLAAATVDFDVSLWFTKLQLAGVDRVSQMAVAAAELAWRDTAIDGVEPERIGVYVGCGMGGATAIDVSYTNQAMNGRVPPLTVPACMTNAPAAHVSMRLKAIGPVMTYSIACASSAVAIAEAAKAIEAGEIDVAIAGGCEALLVPGAIRSWQALQTLSSFDLKDPASAAFACRPFDRQRSGFSLAEGAAFIVLESAEHARARKARSYANIIGSAVNCDAKFLTKPDVNGQMRALTLALQRSGLSASDIGYCNAHGTATRVGDPVECAALRNVWGPSIDHLKVSSTKSMHGHMLGGAGALEAAITALALHRQEIPPTAHCNDIDPECALNIVRNQGEAAPQLQAAISSSFAFGGTNAVLVFQRA